MALNEEQKRIVEFASEGHNLLITGQAGAGKSRVVKSVVKRLLAKKLSVKIVCSSGIACKVYTPGTASTVHSAYGLNTATLPWKQVLQRAKSNFAVSTLLRNVDVVV